MSDRLPVLRNSVRHLSDVASRLDPADYTSSAYPSEWSIADTFSHLGSGAVIGKHNFEDAITQRESDSSFNASVWDEWNAKEPVAQVTDSLASDDALLSYLEATTEEERKEFRYNMGPFAFDFDGLVGLRLSEHVLHTWDVEVAIDPTAVVSNDAANAILNSIDFVVVHTAKPTGDVKSVRVRTIEPVRDFTLVLDNDSVNIVEARHEGDVDLELPAEALVRLIYGRLDAEHAHNAKNSDVVDYLRRVFPGF